MSKNEKIANEFNSEEDSSLKEMASGLQKSLQVCKELNSINLMRLEFSFAEFPYDTLRALAQLC